MRFLLTWVALLIAELVHGQLYDPALLAASVKSSFIPTQAPGMVVWLKADAGTSLSGSNVTAWADQSGSGNDFRAYGGVASQGPIWISNSVNGLPAINVTPSHAFSSVNKVTFGANTNLSIFIVIQLTNSVGSNSHGYSVPSAAQPGYGYWAYFASDTSTTAKPGFYTDSGGYKTFGTITANGSLVQDIEAIVNNSTATCYTNGASVGTTNCAITQATNVSWYLFSPTSGMGALNYGKVCEYLYYTNSVSSSDRGKIESYLKIRWGL